MGRKLPFRYIGSTLLVKGLEFDHAVVVQSANMAAKDWYVALTRTTRTIRIVSSHGLGTMALRQFFLICLPRHSPDLAFVFVLT